MLFQPVSAKIYVSLCHVKIRLLPQQHHEHLHRVIQTKTAHTPGHKQTVQAQFR